MNPMLMISINTQPAAPVQTTTRLRITKVKKRISISLDFRFQYTHVVFIDDDDL